MEKSHIKRPSQPVQCGEMGRDGTTSSSGFGNRRRAYTISNYPRGKSNNLGKKKKKKTIGFIMLKVTPKVKDRK